MIKPYLSLSSAFILSIFASDSRLALILLPVVQHSHPLRTPDRTRAIPSQAAWKQTVRIFVPQLCRLRAHRKSPGQASQKYHVAGHLQVMVLNNFFSRE
ncbi:hypothetical protein C8R43DRAFT_975649 [Mycena crocata]|nr:hypothetical protein C8R43DRAFT_975649 [Mycena crocata]